jgi:hypothetical protein
MIALWLVLAAGQVCEAPKLSASYLPSKLKLDGELDEAAWVSTPSSGAFAGLDGKPIAPHTELRALWTKTHLVLGVYSADQDLRATDVVHFVVNGVSLDVNAKGQLLKPLAGVNVAVERDGTLDAEEGDADDEEWLIELQVPWSVLGLTSAPRQVPLVVWREDTPKGAPKRTVSWASCDGRPGAGLLLLSPAR